MKGRYRKLYCPNRGKAVNFRLKRLRRKNRNSQIKFMIRMNELMNKLCVSIGDAQGKIGVLRYEHS